jgi:choloylglycine hydrolase
MKKHLSRFIFIILWICLLPVPGMPCTAFVLDNNGQPVFGENTDLGPMPAYVIVNKRGVAKTTIPNNTNPVITWTSKFGSVTFTFYARELPGKGINEAGLFIAGMSTYYHMECPEPDSRPPINCLQWIQYQLDNFSTVNEVIASDQIMRITQPPGNAGVHYLVSDSTGKCASIEFIGGEMVYHTGWSMPVKVLANSTYDQSVANFRWFRFLSLFSPIPIPDDQRPSLLRFAIAADRVKKYKPQRSGPAVNYAFNILEEVTIRTTGRALWSTVYDIANKKIYFRSFNNAKIRQFDISTFDFSCTTPVQALDVNAALSGDVTNSFVDYTEDMSREMLESQWPPLPDEAIDLLATGPDKYTHCTE